MYSIPSSSRHWTSKSDAFMLYLRYWVVLTSRQATVLVADRANGGPWCLPPDLLVSAPVSSPLDPILIQN
jgi:hypothetical protein